MSALHVLGTLAATALFCLAFFRGGRVRFPARVRRRTVVSVAGGAAGAYVFVDLLPTLAAAAGTFRDATSHLGIRVLHIGVYLATLVGFLCFYGVEELVIRSRSEEERQRRREQTGVHPLFRVHVTAFAVYAWMVGYLVVRSTAQTLLSLAFYTLAMALHFMAVAHVLREEHGARFDRIGTWTLAGGCAVGWACGVLIAIPDAMINILLGAVAGGIIANTVISELPRERQGEFVPFLMGAAAYTGLLVAAG